MYKTSRYVNVYRCLKINGIIHAGTVNKLMHMSLNNHRVIFDQVLLKEIVLSS